MGIQHLYFEKCSLNVYISWLHSGFLKHVSIFVPAFVAIRYIFIEDAVNMILCQCGLTFFFPWMFSLTTHFLWATDMGANILTFFLGDDIFKVASYQEDHPIS